MPTYPPGYKQTRMTRRAAFKPMSIAAAVAFLQDEVRRMGGTNLRLEDDLRKRNDGLPYSVQRQPEDQGVVVYFTLSGGKKVAMPCDRWDRIEHNYYAVAMTIEAKRGIERWGAASEEAEYEGYLLLGAGSAPPVPVVESAPEDPPHVVLGVLPDAPREVIEGAWRSLAGKHHPDRGGSPEAFHRLTKARDALLLGR